MQNELITQVNIAQIATGIGSDTWSRRLGNSGAVLTLDPQYRPESAGHLDAYQEATSAPAP